MDTNQIYEIVNAVCEETMGESALVEMRFFHLQQTKRLSLILWCRESDVQ